MEESWLGQALPQVIARKNGVLPLFECKRKRCNMLRNECRDKATKLFARAGSISNGTRVGFEFFRCYGLRKFVAARKGERVHSFVYLSLLLLNFVKQHLQRLQPSSCELLTMCLEKFYKQGETNGRG